MIRRRGTCIIKTPDGIMIAAGKRKQFLLPGGGANKNESRRAAAIRELKEETGLIATSCKYLFSYDETIYNNDNKKFNIIDKHKVFLITAEGKPEPNYEDVSFIEYWKDGKEVDLSNTTKKIIEKWQKIEN